MSKILSGVDAIKGNASRPLNKIWLNLLRMEFLLTGFLLCWNSLFTIEIRTNYILHVTMSGVRRRLLAEGIFLLLIGIVILSIPRISVFLRKNKISAYLIPMHMWLALVVLGMEVVLRITIYNPPFNSVRTTWFGWVAPQGSFTLWGKEGYAITRFDGQIPGEIQTPFHGGDNILVLGDSFTEALQVPDNQKYASVAEIVLHQDGYNFDLHNFGHSGRTMADYVSKMQNYRTLYHPKAIVIQLTENDFIESFDTEKSNYFVAENSKIVDIVRTGKFKGKFLVADTMSSNFTFSLLEHAKGRLSILMNDRQDPTVQINESSTPQTFDVALAKQQMDLLIEAGNGETIILIITPHAPYISGDDVEINDLKHQNLKTFLSNYPQIILVDPLPEFQQLALSGHLPMGFFNSTQPGLGHLNRRGHEILGELLAQTIEEVVK
jgi:hypothetical protein